MLQQSAIDPTINGDRVIDVMESWPEIRVELDLSKSQNESFFYNNLTLNKDNKYVLFYSYGKKDTWAVSKNIPCLGLSYKTFQELSLPFEDQIFKFKVALKALKNENQGFKKISVTLMIPRSSWDIFDIKEGGAYIGLPSICLALAPEGYQDKTPPFQNIFGTTSARFNTPKLWFKINQSKQKTQLAIDVGSFGNVVANVKSTGQVVSLLAAPIHDFEIKTLVEVNRGDINEPKPLWSQRRGFQSNFPSVFIKGKNLSANESMNSELIFGEIADQIISTQSKEGSDQLFQSIRWSAKSYVGEEDFSVWSQAVADGIKRRGNLPRGVTRDGLKASAERHETMISGEPSRLYLSYPSTWMQSQRAALQTQLARSFELSKEHVHLIADEATAGAFGWLSELIGTDADPATTLSLLSTSTLFLKSDAQQIQQKTELLKKHIQPFHILVLDSGAGTTDISLIRLTYNEKNGDIEAETIARQGFIAGGLELSKAIVSSWKSKLGLYYEEESESHSIYEESIKKALCTRVGSDQDVEAHELERRTKLLLAFHNLAELTKRSFTSEEVDLSIAKSTVISLLKVEGFDDPDHDRMEECLTLSEDDLKTIYAEVLGASIIGAVDLPVQYSINKIDQVFLLGRTLRLPGITEAFMNSMKTKVETLHKETGKRWDHFIPTPGKVHSWSHHHTQCKNISEESNLHPDIDKHAVVNGLALIARARKATVQSMKFKPYDKNFKQRFIGMGRMESWYWRYDLLSGALPGQKPEEFEPGESIYEIKLNAQGAEELDIMWNNLGRSQGMKIKIGELECVVPAERAYKLGVLKISEGTTRAHLLSMNLAFTLIEDGRVALKRIDVELEDGATHSGHYSPKIDPTRILEQSLKVAHIHFVYQETPQEVDYRDSGYISDIYDSDS